MIWGRGVAKNIIDFAVFSGLGGTGSLPEVAAVITQPCAATLEVPDDGCNSSLEPPFHRNFGRLVLVCIDSYDSESRRIF